jgi:hypothetical protein
MGDTTSGTLSGARMNPLLACRRRSEHQPQHPSDRTCLSRLSQLAETAEPLGCAEVAEDGFGMQLCRSLPNRTPRVEGKCSTCSLPSHSQSGTPCPRGERGPRASSCGDGRAPTTPARSWGRRDARFLRSQLPLALAPPQRYFVGPRGLPGRGHPPRDRGTSPIP